MEHLAGVIPLGDGQKGVGVTAPTQLGGQGQLEIGKALGAHAAAEAHHRRGHRAAGLGQLFGGHFHSLVGGEEHPVGDLFLGFGQIIISAADLCQHNSLLWK